MLLICIRSTRQRAPVQDEPLAASPFAESLTKLAVRDGFPIGAPCAIPPGYQREEFHPKIICRLVREYGIPEYHVYYFGQKDDGSDQYYTCPIGECVGYFQGHSIRNHLRSYHKDINDRNRDPVKCTVRSNESSRCSPENAVQGRYFEKHFMEVHLDNHFLCPFCMGRQRRVGQFFEHFGKCKRLWARNQ